jgi:hypothetical protein
MPRTLTDDELDLYGLRSADAGGVLFCGVSEQFAINGVTLQWPRNSKLTWGLDFARLGALSDMDLKDAITAAIKEVTDVCDIPCTFIKDASRANLKIIQTRLDGRSGVLADCQMPHKNAHQDTTQLVMRFDVSEIWGLAVNPSQGMIDFYRTFLHEYLHFKGLAHAPANIRALISAMYSVNVRNLLEPDKAELLRRYPATVKPGTPTPGSGKCLIEKIIVNVDGKRFEASGTASPMQLVEG